MPYLERIIFQVARQSYSAKGTTSKHLKHPVLVDLLDFLHQTGKGLVLLRRATLLATFCCVRRILSVSMV
jgi:hypothetical protein